MQQARQRHQLCSTVVQSHQQRQHQMCITAHRGSPVPLQIMVTWIIGMLLLVCHLFAACIADVLETVLILSAKSSCSPKGPVSDAQTWILYASCSIPTGSKRAEQSTRTILCRYGPHIHSPCADIDCTHMYVDFNVSHICGM